MTYVIIGEKHCIKYMFCTRDDNVIMCTVPLTYVITGHVARQVRDVLNRPALVVAVVFRGTQGIPAVQMLLSKSFFSFIVPRGTPKI